jgi:hypothetical protein
MKKQILVLVILVVAVFASFTKSYGQTAVAPTVVAPRTLDAAVANDPMKPIAGKPYTYSATINPATGNAYWYATKQTTFMTGGSRPASIEELATGATPTIISDATTGNYMKLAATASDGTTSTTITWTSALLKGRDATDNPLFMVVEYNGPVCTTSNNVKVIQITPQNAFTIDLTNVKHDTQTALAYLATESQCYAGITSSSWVKGSGMTNVYGANVLYFELVAANFSGGFKPTFQISGLKGTQTADIAWDYTIGGTYTNVAGTAIAAPGNTTSAQTVLTDLTNTNGGAAIYIKVTVHNNSYEGLTADDITLKVDAVDNSGNDNVDHTGTSEAAYAESAMQTLNARPSITPGTGVTFQ